MNNQNKVRDFYLEKLGGLPDFSAVVDYDEEEAGEVFDELWLWSTDSECYHQIPLDRIDKGRLAKELADRMFTGYGVALAAGINLDKAFKLVCESNMTKEPTAEGKVQKGKDYVEPDMSQCVL